MVNELLQNLRLISQPIHFLDSDSGTYIKMLLWSLWKGLGWGFILYLAPHIRHRPRTLRGRQADGASRFQQIIYVTVL